jgi:hypothetical protein
MRGSRIVCFLAVMAGLLFAFTAWAKPRMEHGGRKHHGPVGITTFQGRYLQAHTDGEMHGSNDSRKSEETWILVEHQPIHGAPQVAFRNYRTGNYLRPAGGECVRADTQAPSLWELHRAADGRFTIKSLETGKFLRTNSAGDNHNPCGGEVWSSTDLQAGSYWTFARASNTEGSVDVDWVGLFSDAADVIGIIASFF